MSFTFDAERLEKVLADFYRATGAPMDLLKPDVTSVYVPLLGIKKYCDVIRDTREGRRRCGADNLYLVEQCNKTKDAAVQVCHAKVVHLMVPVLSGDEIVAYLAIGRFRTADSFPKDNNPLADLPLDEEEMCQAWNELTHIDDMPLDSIISLAKMVAVYLVTEKIIKTVSNENLERVEEFIDEHLSEDLSIERISRETNISKSVLYRNFSSHLGTTISEYINLKRVEVSVGLLTKTDLSIDEIAHRAGFSSSAYYVSVFKRCKGMTPLQFRKKKFLRVNKCDSSL